MFITHQGVTFHKEIIYWNNDTNKKKTNETMDILKNIIIHIKVKFIELFY